MLALPDAAIVDPAVGLHASCMHELSNLEFAYASCKSSCFFLAECPQAQL